MAASRVSIKRVYDTYFRTEAAKNVFIYGIRDGGIGLAKAIRSEKPMHYRLRGFISHDPALEQTARARWASRLRG